ncbi:MAG: homocysteine S-methyltransferase family protein [Prevotella sp.]|nr:homocysteine S-methyltransferase family protein [Prevotella sp.]MDY4037826.1 homocysteine S-methyltransferase family protein [Prevotella sp.]
MAKRNIQLLDGAAGTTMWEHTDDRGPVWRYNIDHPEIPEMVAKEFAEAGATIVTTNTFSANAPTVERNSDYSVEEIVSKGVKIAKDALRGTGVKVALDCGPLAALLEPFGDLTRDECRRIYEQMISAGMSENPDLIYLMTFMDLDMMQIATDVAKQYHVPVFCSMTFTEFGATLMGNTVDQIVTTLAPMGIDAIGLNCSLGPDAALPIIRQFKEATSLPTLFKPNAGKPISNGQAETRLYTPEAFAKDFVPAFEYADYVGGCCGTNGVYLTAIRHELELYQQ